MEYRQDGEIFIIDFRAENQVFVGAYFVVLGATTILLSLVLFRSVTLAIMASASILAGVIIWLTAPRINTMANMAQQSCTIAQTNRLGKITTRHNFAISDILNVELSAFRYDARKNAIGKVLYLNTKDGQQIKLAAQQNYNSPLAKKPVSKAEFIRFAETFAAFLQLPLSTDDKLRALDS